MNETGGRGANVTNRAEFGAESAAAFWHQNRQMLRRTVDRLRRSDDWEALLKDQHSKTVGRERNPRHEADLSRRYGEIGISAVAAAVRYRADDVNERAGRWQWRREQDDAA